MAGGGMVDRTTALVETAVTALPRMLDPRTGLFVFTMRPSGPAGESLRYTCIALIGLVAATRAGWRTNLDIPELVANVTQRARDITNLGELGLLLWCLSDHHQTLTPAHDEILARVPTEADRLDTLTSTELGWLVSGLARTAQLAPARQHIGECADAAWDVLRGNHAEATGLFGYGGRTGGRLRRHLRRQLGFFDNQVYGIQAGVDYYRAFKDRTALAMAERCADHILAAQGALGQWAWHYDVRTGAIVDRYPVYSVHQHGMAPMALRAVAEVTGRSFDGAIDRSLAWLFGANELGKTMIDHERGVIWRSIRRRVAHGKLIHVFKLLSLAGLEGAREHLAGMVNTCSRMERDLECRPYELGWLLLALARR